VRSPSRTLLAGDLEAVVRTAHHVEAAALLRVEFRSAHQLSEPEREALRVRVSWITEERHQQWVGEDAFIEARRQPLEGG